MINYRLNFICVKSGQCKFTGASTNVGFCASLYLPVPRPRRLNRCAPESDCAFSLGTNKQTKRTICSFENDAPIHSSLDMECFYAQSNRVCSYCPDSPCLMIPMCSEQLVTRSGSTSLVWISSRLYKYVLHTYGRSFVELNYFVSSS